MTQAMPDIEPFEALALSLYHNSGTYALLVGSGLSRAAGIPTGWEITLDLIRRLGAVRGVKDSANWEAWYRKQFKKGPNYSEVLDALGANAAERRSILHGYIEAQKGDDARRPTKAHHAIAELVSHGVVRVILTTNFDKLIEDALNEVGVRPTVIASEDALIGATPLIHSPCTVIKLHGDYLDARIKNTDAELGSYAKPIDNLLDEVFDRFGLVVAGWSGEWDTALRAAILRTPSRRYALYWAARGKPTQLAREIIDHRAGKVVPIVDADAFFRRLSDTIDALRNTERPHPESAALAVALAKKYCRDDAFALEWTELLTTEVEKLRKFLNGPEYLPRQPSDSENMAWLIHQFVGRTAILRSVALVAGRWGTAQAVQAIVRATSLLATLSPLSGITAWIELRPLAAALCFYWTLLGLMAREDYQSIARLMHARATTPVGEYRLVMGLPVIELAETGVWKLMKGYERQRYPGSDWLLDLMKTEGRQVGLVEDEIEDLFDRLEFLITLEYARWRSKEPDVHFWAPPGLYIWRRNSLGRQRAWVERTMPALLRAGLVGEGEALAKQLLATVDAHLAKMPTW
jgi:hypothetical protein